MTYRPRHAIPFCSALAIALSIVSGSASAAEVWSGLTYLFSKPDGADGMSIEYRDFITGDVIFARGFSAGLFNAAKEAGWSDTGPKFTEWATDLVAGNEGQNIFAANYENLAFTNWLAAYGGGGDEGLHLRMQHRSAVVHLIEDDIYLDIEFSYWGAGRFGGGGGFAYMRAEPPATGLDGDYNGDSSVDAADYTIWRNSFGMEVEEGTGADGVADGMINELDYNFWKAHFGGSPPMGGGSGATSVPEPANLLLLLVGLLIMAGTRKLSPRGPGHSY